MPYAKPLSKFNFDNPYLEVTVIYNKANKRETEKFISIEDDGIYSIGFEKVKNVFGLVIRHNEEINCILAKNRKAKTLEEYREWVIKNISFIKYNDEFFWDSDTARLLQKCNYKKAHIMLTLHNLHTLLATTSTHMAQAYSLPNWRYFTNAHIPFTTYRWEDSAGDYHITYNIPRDHASNSVLLSWKLLYHGNTHKGSMRFTCKGFTEGTEINSWHLTDSKAWKNGVEVYHLNLDPIYLEFQSLILPHLHHIDRWVYEC